MTNCFVYSYVLNGKLKYSQLTLEQINDWDDEDGLLWLHLNYNSPDAQEWIKNSDLPDIEKDSLLASRIRPRANRSKDGLFLALRAINLNDSPKEDDMTSVRGYFTKHLIVTTSNHDIDSLQSIANHIRDGFGPKNTGSFIVSLCDHLASHKMNLIDILDDQVTDLEDRILAKADPDLRSDVAVIRRQTVYTRRYVAPQRDALAKLMTTETPLLSLTDRQKLHEVNDKLSHVLDDLNSIRERANVTQEELMSLQSESLNQRVYFLSLVTTIFLPLGFLTGLLGVNLGGIPGAQDGRAFTIFCILLAFVFMLQLLFFYRRKWI
ncbi:TPA: zinc transporter ZntB [Photobacterium damselae]